MNQFGTINERLPEISKGTVCFPTIIIIQFQRREQTNQFLPFFRMRLNPVPEGCFCCALLFQHFQVPDGFIHSYAVFPVVGTFIVFRSILDTDIRMAIHFPLPNSLFYPAHINHGLINAVHHFFDPIRREIALRTARIAESHTERAFLVSIQRNRSYVFRMIRDVLR